MTRDRGRQCLKSAVASAESARGKVYGATGVRSWSFWCVKELARMRGARRTGTRRLSSRSSSGRSTQPHSRARFPEATATPGGVAGFPFPFWLRLQHRGSAHLRNYQGAACSPSRRQRLAQNRFSSHLSWGSRLLVGFCSCRLQCPICTRASELPKPVLNPPGPHCCGGKVRLLRPGLTALAGSACLLSSFIRHLYPQTPGSAPAPFSYGAFIPMPNPCSRSPCPQCHPIFTICPSHSGQQEINASSWEPYCPASE